MNDNMKIIFIFPHKHLAVWKQFLSLSIRQALLTILVSPAPPSWQDNPSTLSKRVDSGKIE